MLGSELLAWNQDYSIVEGVAMTHNENKVMRRISVCVTVLTCIVIYLIIGYGIYEDAVFRNQSEKYMPKKSADYKTYVAADKGEELSEEQKVNDFLFLSKMLEESTFLKGQTEELLHVSWEERNEDFRKMVEETENDVEFYFVMRRYLNEMNSIHTYVVDPNYDNYLSFSGARTMQNFECELSENKVGEFEQKLSNAAKETEEYQERVFIYIQGNYYEVGSDTEIVRVNGNEDIYGELNRAGICYRTEYDSLRERPYYPFVVLNEGYGERLLIELSDGEKKSLFYAPEVERRVSKNGIKALEKGRSTFLYLWEDETAYVRIGSLSRNRSVELKDVMELLEKEEREVNNIVFDLRGNGGGIGGNVMLGVLDKIFPTTIRTRREFFLPYTEWNKRLLEETYGIDKENTRITENVPEEITEVGFCYLMKEELSVGSKKNKQRDIYVLVNNDTASAADWLAHDLREYMSAVIVGVNTNGEGLSESPAYTLLPNSGLLVSYFDSYAENSQGKSNSMYGTTPDYYVENTIEDLNSREYSEENLTSLMKTDSQLKYVLEELIPMEQ